MRGPGRRSSRFVPLRTAPPPPRRSCAAGHRHRRPEPFKDPSFGSGPAHLVLARDSQPRALHRSERSRHFRALKLGPAFPAAPCVLPVKFITCRERWSSKDRERYRSEGFV
ncbi:hypothetical protein CapIbe_008536 [Capra ibex]